MENAIYVALSAQVALRRHMEIVANNMANLSSPGFKAERMMFREFLQKTDGASANGAKEQVSFVQDYASYRDLSEGPIVMTGAEFDVAIAGEGYLQVDTPNGPRYTRAGSLSLDTQRRLVTAQGYPVLSTGGAPITLPNDAIEVAIAEDGTVSSRGQDSKINNRIDQIAVVDFDDPRQVRNDGDGMVTTELAPRPADKARLIQGAIEQSNAQGVREMTDMMDILRGYQMVQKTIDAEIERKRDALQQLSKTTAA